MRQEPSKDLIDETISAWQHRSAAPLTEEDARQILTNVTTLLRLLAEWEEQAEDHLNRAM